MGFYDGDEEYRHSRRSRASVRSAASQLETLDLNAAVPAGCGAGVPSFPPAAGRSASGPGVTGSVLETAGSWTAVDEPYARRGSSSRHSRRRRGLGSVEIEDGILTMQTSTRSSTTSHEGGDEGGIDTLGIPGWSNAIG